MKASVSVVIPVYNSFGTLARSLDSIVSQRLSVEEVIVVDDGSSEKEGARELIDQYKSQLDIRLFELDNNCGAAYARNFGVAKARSKYIAFLDSDDVWGPNKVEVQYAFMERGNFHLTGHEYIFDLSILKFPFFSMDRPSYRVISWVRFLWGNPIFTPTVMVRRDNFVFFDSKFRRMEDYKCWFENLKKGKVAKIEGFFAGGFKEPIGSSGLSGSVELMHKDYVAVLRSLYENKGMSLVPYFIARTIEFFKYPLRVLKLNLRAFFYVRNKT